MKELKRYLRRTRNNKICALVMILSGLVPLLISNDGTFTLFAIIIGIPLFFAKENWIY